MGLTRGILPGLIVGGIFGWSFGWLLFEPDSLLWIPTTIIGLMIGFIISRSSMFEMLLGPLCASAIGLFAGVLFVTWLYGDHIDGVGSVMAMVGAILGWKIGGSSYFKDSNSALGVLLGIINFGFGVSLLFLISISILSVSFINLTTITIIFLTFSVLGGLLGKCFLLL